MAKKIIALLAVLALVITPLFVIGEDAQADDPDKLTLDLIKDSDLYWVKGTLDTSTGIMTLTNNASSTKFIPLETTTTGTVNKVVPGPNFNVPEKATLVVKSTPFEINKNMTVYGTFASDVDTENNSLTKVVDDATLTFDGATIGYVTETEPLPIWGPINLGMGSSVVFDNSTFILTSKISLNSVPAFEFNTTVCSGVTVKNASTTTEPKLEFTGTVTGLNSEVSDITLKTGVVYSFKNFALSELWMDIEDITKNLFLYNDNKIIDLTNGVTVYASQQSLFGLKSGGDTNLLIADVVYVSSGGTDSDPFRIKATIDSDGMTAYFTLVTMASTGIKSIDAEKRIAFLEVGEVVDLTQIAITCESGYHFVGWYYEDHNGKMVKVLDPANYVAVDDVTLYAMAEADVPAGHDYTGFFIGLIILLALIVLAACVGIYLKATERSAQKTVAKKASKR